MSDQRLPGVAGPVLTEKAFQALLVDALETFGWAVQHVYPLQTKHGWRSGTTLSGWPDLVAIRREFVLCIEVKGERTHIEPRQRAVLELMAQLRASRCWVLRPQDDWREIVEWVRRPAEAPKVHGWKPLDEAQWSTLNLPLPARLTRREHGKA